MIIVSNIMNVTNELLAKRQFGEIEARGIVR